MRGVLGVGILVLVVAPLLFVGGVYLVASDLLGVGGPDPEPPKAALYHEGRKAEPVLSAIGCWREKRRLLPDNGACVNSQGWGGGGQKPSQGGLRVKRGDTLAFESSWRSVPKGISARTVRTDVPFDEQLALKQDTERDYERLGAYYPPQGYQAREVPVRMAGKRGEVVADLPPGDYVITFSMRVDDAEATGEAFYDFEVIVER